MKPIIRAAALGFAICTIPVLAACGSDSTTKVETTTTGQQLVDLQTAYDSGAISKSEYESKRRDILRKD